MATFKVKTKNKIDIDKKPRVYFTCHPDDFGNYFKKVCDDIFKTHDCAIYYIEDMNDTVYYDERETDLGRNNLFVVPVTYKLLSTANRAMDEDIPYALKEHIPILPVMMEPELDALYAKHDKLGELQYLNPYSRDLTEISYEEKLKRYLDSVLISDMLAKRVRAAFDAYIFLSYRKKDRKYANELMRLVHSNPECRNIAIWFDEFLTPGESFKETIEKMLDDCNLFMLLVTPKLLEKIIDENGLEQDNYVISTELPLAKKKKEEKGTDIFAVEMEKTDREKLSAIDIEDYVGSSDEAFRTRLLESISKLAITENNTSEHNFLIGIAYLEGIDMEVDRSRGVSLITSAAEDGLVEAMEMLYRMYRDGVAVKINYRKAAFWAEKIVEYYTKLSGERNPITRMYLNQLVIAYHNTGEYEKALECSKKGYEMLSGSYGMDHAETLVSCANLAASYARMGDYKKATELCREVYEKRLETLGENDIDTLTAMANLSFYYSLDGDFSNAVEFGKKVCEKSLELLGGNDSATLIAMANLANYYFKAGENDRALEFGQEAYKKFRENFGEEHPDTLTAMSKLASYYFDAGQPDKALETEKSVYKKQCEILGEEHPYTLASMSGLASYYYFAGDKQKAFEIGQNAYERYCKVLGSKHPETMAIMEEQAILHSAEYKDKKGLEFARKYFEMMCEAPEKDNSVMKYLAKKLAGSYSKAGNYKKAVEFAQKLYDMNLEELGESHPDVLSCMHHLAGYYADAGNFGRAVRLASIAYDKRSEILGENHPDTLDVLDDLAVYQYKNKNEKKALALMIEVYEKRVITLGEKDIRTIEALKKVIQISALTGNRMMEIIYRDKLKKK